MFIAWIIMDWGLGRWRYISCWAFRIFNLLCCWHRQSQGHKKCDTWRKGLHYSILFCSPWDHRQRLGWQRREGEPRRFWSKAFSDKCGPFLITRVAFLVMRFFIATTSRAGMLAAATGALFCFLQACSSSSADTRFKWSTSSSLGSEPRSAVKLFVLLVRGAFKMVTDSNIQRHQWC